MAALQYVDVPGYAALVLMKTFSDLSLPKAGMSRAREWLAGTRARPIDGGRAWHFPSGASVTFGYLDNLGDEQRYRTAEFQALCIDELTRFPEGQYRFLFSRLRKPKEGPLSAVPVRMRSASNPGGKHGEWVKKRFVPDEYLRAKGDERFGRTWWSADRLFVPARRSDNPTLDQDDYGRMLSRLLPVTRRQLEDGDWSAHEGGHFKREWFRPYDDMGDAFFIPHTGELCKKHQAQVIATVDPAGGVSESADFTAILVAAITPRNAILILELVRERIPVERVIPRLAEVCIRRRPTYVAIEGGFLQSAYVREARRTPGIPTVQAIDPGGQSKLVRATAAIIRAEAGTIFLPRDAPWMDAWESDVYAFTGDERLDANDDVTDAFSYLVRCADRYRVRDDGPALLGMRYGR